MMRRPVTVLAALFLAGAWVLVFPRGGFSQNEAGPQTKSRPSTADVKRLFVPIDRPKEWPQGDWQAVSRDEFEKLLEGLESKPPEPPRAQIQQASYQAVFNGIRLTSGRFQAQIQQAGHQDLLSLDPSRLAFHSLTWEVKGRSAPARWGHPAGGGTLAVLPSQPAAAFPRDLTLQGEWDALGRQLSGRVEFQLNLLPAAINELDLLLPGNWDLAASTGRVTGPMAISDDAPFGAISQEQRSRFKLWRISLGSETETHLTLSQITPSSLARPLVLSEAHTTYVIERHEFQVEARYELNVAFAPISQIAFEVPHGIQIFAVTYGGDAGVSWQTIQQGARRRVVLDLPDPLLGKSRPIRIQGLGNSQIEKSWRLPPVTCPEATLLHGELHLNVQSPLEVRSFEAKGFRQTSISVEPDVRETLRFAQIAPDRDAALTAFVGLPEFSASAHTVSRLSTGTEEWLMQTEITWSAQAGSRFAANCAVLSGWEILDVRRASSASAPVISDWRVSRPTDETPSRLTIEFLEALTPMHPKRVLVLARRLPLTAGQTMSLSSLKPLECESVEQFLAVHSGTSELLTPASSTENLLWTGIELPGFVEASSILDQINPKKSEPTPQRFLARTDLPNPRLRIKSAEPPYGARVHVRLDVLEGQVEETLEFSIEPVSLPVERFSFLARDLGEGWVWELAENPNQRLGNPQRSESSEEGGLGRWEISLPAGRPKPFRVRAKRVSPFAANKGIVLPVAQAADRFQGVVELNSSVGAAPNVQAFAMQEAPESEQGTRRWLYQTDQARLALESPSLAGLAPNFAGDLELLSLIIGYDDSAIHKARFDLRPITQTSPFRFQLPETARLIGVRVNGEEAAAQKSNGDHVVPALPVNQRNEVEVLYETPWNAQGMSPSCPVPIPQTEISIVDCRWRFAVSPDLSLAHVQGAALVSADSEPGWTTRFFGPIGRGAGERVFLPWQKSSWTALFAPRESRGGNESDSEEQFFPAAWTVHEARGMSFSADLELGVWRHSQASRLAWLALLGSLMFGFAFRVWEWKYRRHAGAAWLLANLIAAGFLPMPWAMISGSALAGTIIAWLFPRRLLIRQRQPVRSHSTPGSTASFHSQPAGGSAFFFIAGLCLWAWAAGEFPHFALGQTAPNGSSTEGINQSGIPAINVMVPVDDPRNPKADSSLVYVDRAFLRNLRASQPQPPVDAGYLLSRADYRLNVDSAGAVDVSAAFQILVLRPDHPVTVRLPIDHAYLGGPGHCKVDGLSHPVLFDDASKQYLIELSPAAENTISPQPAIAEKTPARSTLSKPVTRRIVLQMHGQATDLPNGNKFSLSIPQISNSSMRVRLPKTFAAIALRTSHGESFSAAPTRTLWARIGATPTFDLLWSQEPAPLEVASRQKAQVFALATIHPLRTEWQIRVKFRVSSGVTSMNWYLPRNTLVRDVKSERLKSYRVLRQGGQTRLDLAVENPLESDLVLDLACMTPLDERGMLKEGRARLPELDLFGGQRQAAPTVDAEYQIGVDSTPELSLGMPDPAALTSAGIAVVPPDRFLSAYRESASSSAESLRSPQLALLLTKPGPVEFSLEPRRPLRRVWLNQQGQIRERELDWSLSADIETSGAAAFRHVLRVPAALRIDSISVQEDETERLVRWSRSGDRIDLVLSDGTTGMQQVRLAGRMPIVLAPEIRISLPLIEIENAETADSHLYVSLSHDATHHASITGIEDLPALETRAYDADHSESRLIAGVRLVGRAEPVAVVTRRVAKARFDEATLVKKLQKGQAGLTTWIRFKNLPDAARRMTVRIPFALTEEFLVTHSGKPGEIVPYETITQADQSLFLVFHSRDLDRFGALQITSAIDPPPDDGVEIPRIQVMDGNADDSLLLMTEDFTTRPTEQGQGATPVPVDQLPDWLLEISEIESSLKDLRVASNLERPWKIFPVISAEQFKDREASVHTELWLTTPKLIAGLTTLEFPGELPRNLAWDWPPETTVLGAVLDGKSVPSTGEKDAKTVQFFTPLIPADRGGRKLRRLVVSWAQKRHGPVPRFGKLQFSLPRPRGLEIQSNTIEVIPPRPIRLIAENGVESTGSAASSAGGFVGELDASDSTWSLTFWTLDARAEYFLLIGVLAAALGGLMYWGLGLDSGDWLDQHVMVSFGLIGLFWWGCLSQSPVGFAVLALSPILAFAARKRTSANDVTKPAMPPELTP